MIQKNNYISNVTVLLPSLIRYKKMFFGNNLSILRCLQYEKLNGLSLHGRVLDFGGGDIINYSEIVSGWFNNTSNFHYDSINIDKKTKPTFLLNADQKFPIEDNSYDFIISLNTLEHVFEIDKALSEISRTLKNKGTFFFTVPFMFRVHGHPDDFIRGTPSFWIESLKKQGFTKVEVNALTWGPFSTGQSVSGIPGPFKRIRKHLALLVDIFYAVYKFKNQTYFSGPQDQAFLSSPVGYFITAVKL